MLTITANKQFNKTKDKKQFQMLNYSSQIWKIIQSFAKKTVHTGDPKTKPKIEANQTN